MRAQKAHARPPKPLDQGYFPRGASMLRRVHEERLVVLFYGQRALCIGALAPLNYVGTSEHSYAKLTPFPRLVHTGNAFEKIYFGSRGEADQVLAYVGRLHERVKGTLSQDAGVTPAGTPYATAFEIPLPRVHQLAKPVHDLIMLGSMPQRARELYGLSYTSAQAASFHATVRSLAAARKSPPGHPRRGGTRGRSNASPAPSAAASSTTDRRRRYAPPSRGAFCRAYGASGPAQIEPCWETTAAQNRRFRMRRNPGVARRQRRSRL